jgi:hypothetical protein
LEEKEQLTEQQVNQVLNAFDFLTFSNSYRDTYYNTYFTPDLINQQMKNVNMQPVDATIEGMEQALKNPKDSEQILRNYATTMENQSMYYKRLIRYFSDMASFNLNYDCVNIEKDSDFKSKEYKEDLKVLDNFCSTFDFKQEFSTVLRQLFRQGVYYCVLRKDGTKYTLQELPPDFCKITGRHAYGLLFDFDMNWFIGNYGVDINMYPKVFKKMYRQVFNKISKAYDPHMPVDKRSSTYVYWHQCNPSDGFWCWKLSPEIATIVPYFSPMFPDMGFQPTVRKLQNNKYFIEASKLLVGILGFNKETKSGQVANQLNMTPDILGKFLGVARQGLSKEIGLIALPVDDVKTVDFDVSDQNIVSDYVKSLSQQGLSSTDVLLTSNKLNSHQSKLASAVDGNVVKSVYAMFADFVDYYVNRETKKFKFHVSFHDLDIPDDRAERETRFKTTASMGIVDIQYAARMFDLSPFEFDRRLLMSKSSGLEDKLISLMSLNNQSAAMQKNGVGRPSTEGTAADDNDSTEASRARGSNELK